MTDVASAAPACDSITTGHCNGSEQTVPGRFETQTRGVSPFSEGQSRVCHFLATQTAMQRAPVPWRTPGT
jgi:hypothetical protein